jgi:putative two-component system response regulator
MGKWKVFIVDDEPINVQILWEVLGDGYQRAFAASGEQALRLIREQPPDLILLDIMMPGMDGHEVCRRLKGDPATAAIPVIFVTALADGEDERRGFEVGAVDYIEKPISPPVVRARVRTHLSLYDQHRACEQRVRDRTAELEETRLQIIQRLGRAAEYKDNETGLHVMRMSHYSRAIAHALGWPRADRELLLHAAPMHDVGKIGIPDHILRKPGQLDDEEWRVMRLHPEIGASIIGSGGGPLLEAARIIALTHHERWDGGGYPEGLVGEAIPLVGRVVALADVFDALTSGRPYKSAWGLDQALDTLRNERGRHFDPQLVDAFFDALPEILEVRQRWGEG